MAVIASLKGDRAFQRLRRGRPGGARLLSVRWRPNRSGTVGVGIVVSKKVGKAVVRNRVRRRLREALRALLARGVSPAAQHRGQPSFDLVIIARPEAAEASYQQLAAALQRALERGKVV
ncbi:MAG TPA: ribonuclease P protein component [Trueperaceae bacterium]